MIRQYELIDKILKYNEKADVALLNRAYVFSMKAHGNQKRASGEPYLTHPLEVSSILADLRMDDATIAAGLLHDTIEDTLATYEEIKELFGAEIADLTEGVTKLSKLEFNNKKMEQAENYRKLFLAMSKDIRVLLIKVADRLHNVRTLSGFSKVEKKRRVAQETMDIFVPLADRIGLYTIKLEMEDICFRELNPEAYEHIEERMKNFREHGDLVNRVVEILQDDMTEVGIDCEIKGREKAVYSIHRKMMKKNLTFDQLTDVVAYRIIAENQTKCYEILGHIHNIYKAIPGRFKDYISNSKPNGYQSLHTSIIGPFGNRMEIQIRDKEMDAVADSGVAAHWLYKQQTGATQTEGMQYRWVKSLMETLQNSEDPDELIENAKLDLFKDNVFIFSPKGDLVSLPSGATPLDFAYHIHSEIGNKCQSAKINGRMATLRTPLQNGDQVEVITNKAQQPRPGWREFVVTGKARSAINRYLRIQERDEQIAFGRDIIEKAARKDSLTYPEKDLSKAAKEMNVENIDELYIGLAQGRIFPRQVFDILFPERNIEEPKGLDSLPTGAGPKKGAVGKERRDTRVPIDGLTPGMAIHIAKCCNPVPGENIVGIINTGFGVSIHAAGCSNLEQFSTEPERFLSVRWSGESDYEEADKLFLARLRIMAINDRGTLSNLSTAIFNAEGNIEDLFIENKDTDIVGVRVDVEVKNLTHLDSLLSAIRNLKCVVSVDRLIN